MSSLLQSTQKWEGTVKIIFIQSTSWEWTWESEIQTKIVPHSYELKKKSSQNSQGDTNSTMMTMHWLFSATPVSLTQQNYWELLLEVSLLPWAFSQQRGDTNWGWFLLNYLAQNILWDEEAASRFVSVALHPHGIAASWRRLKPNWNCSKVGLGWELRQLGALWHCLPSCLWWRWRHLTEHFPGVEK